ncbi:MAG: hypothetical protein WA093_04610 [Minisyncoccales bacterium]
MNKKIETIVPSIDELVAKAIHDIQSKNGKKGGKIGGATTKRLYGIEHYRKLAANMNEVKKAKRKSIKDLEKELYGN